MTVMIGDNGTGSGVPRGNITNHRHIVPVVFVELTIRRNDCTNSTNSFPTAG